MLQWSRRLSNPAWPLCDEGIPVESENLVAVSTLQQATNLSQSWHPHLGPFEPNNL